MFFDDPSQIRSLAAQAGTSIFALSDNFTVSLPQARVIAPAAGKTGITVEQVRTIVADTTVKQTSEQFILIRPADQLLPAAQNAILKLLEEPGNHYHFVLVTKDPSLLLPTILSRAAIYYLRPTDPINTPPAVSPQVLALAKQLLVATPRQLPDLAETIAKHKDNPRQYALDITAATIELAYKSYLKTGQRKFLAKVPQLLKLYDNLKQNGHVKLHLVADLC